MDEGDGVDQELKGEMQATWMEQESSEEIAVLQRWMWSLLERRVEL